MTEIETDILVVGAGPVGMTLALKLINDEAPWRVVLVDKRGLCSHTRDPRALALSHGTRQLLEPLGAWNAGAATPIHDIHVSHSGGFGRTLVAREEQGVPALGYVMRYGSLVGGLAAQLGTEGIISECGLCAIAPRHDHVKAIVRRGDAESTIRARLVVHAEGSPGESTDVRVVDYGQHAVLAEVRPRPAHGNRAWERFTPDGPLALLPLGEDYSVVFSVPPAKADALMAMDDETFLAALQCQFGGRLTFAATSPRARFPLALRLRRELVGKREVWIGNAAQTLHPVSGQGFNLGIRDALELAATLQAAPAGDPGGEGILRRYARGRTIDRSGCVAFTDGIVRTFSNDLAPLRGLRGLGLLALDLFPPARRFVAARMIWGARGF